VARVQVPPDLATLREALLRNLRRTLGPEDGDEAFDCHILLAVRVHRAVRLNARASDGEGEAWRRYFGAYFPAGRNSAADAQFLWEKWRTGLLKDESPRAITHGQSGAHWLPLPGGGFCVNLESMWDDFEHSVSRFVQALQADAADAHRRIVLRRFAERAWTVQQVPLVPHAQLFPGPTVYPGRLSVATTSATAMSGTN
jgi:hypothetical protein